MLPDLTGLQKGVAALQRAVTEAQSDAFMAQLTPTRQEIIKAGVIC